MINRNSLLDYGTHLTGATAELMFTNQTYMYKRNAFWDTRSNYRIYENYLKKSMAYYIGNTYLKSVGGADVNYNVIQATGRTGVSWAEIGKLTLGRNVLAVDDEWELTAIGYFLAHFPSRVGGPHWLDPPVHYRRTVFLLKMFRYKPDPVGMALETAYQYEPETAGRTVRHWSFAQGQSDDWYGLYWDYWNP
ncbi:hypothetical protein ACFL2Q_06605 [Thermodesulfobacteriota bacterium]